MNTQDVFLHAMVYLGAALVMVPLAKRLGLGSVLGYLLAGVLIGPFGLDLVGEAGEDVMHFAEFGVVMMLFLVGLELEPAVLWRLRGPILGLGGLQVALTAAIIGLAGVALGLPWQQGLALGLILAMSSTAIALQSLTERGLMKSDAGQKSFAVLLFQDISVIPMLAVFPLLATGSAGVAAEGAHGGSFVEHLSAWGHAGVVLAAIAGVIGGGRLLVPPLMRAVARTGLREMFTAAALALVIAVTIVMTTVGLSPALGTFLAGVVLANSEYRHELESDINPFKGLLLGLFFLSVGASINFSLVVAAPATTAALLLGVTAVKVAVLVGLARVFKMNTDQGAIFAVALSQIGEFAFVLLSLARGGGVLPPSVADPMVAVTALSMAASPLLLALNERLVVPRLRARGAGPERASDVEDEDAEVIIAGYGRFGQIAGRFLRANGARATLLDVDSEQIEVMARFGARVFYGDGSRLDLLRAAGAHKAKVLVVAVDDPAKAAEIVHTARQHFPNLAILARAHGRGDAMDLVEAGVEGVYRETFDSSLRLGVDALRLLGHHAHLAERSARTFRRHDEAALREMAGARGDQVAFVQSARDRLKMLEAALQADLTRADHFGEAGWDSEAIRQGLAPAAAPRTEAPAPAGADEA